MAGRFASRTQCCTGEASTAPCHAAHKIGMLACHFPLTVTSLSPIENPAGASNESLTSAPELIQRFLVDLLHPAHREIPAEVPVHALGGGGAEAGAQFRLAEEADDAIREA